MPADDDLAARGAAGANRTWTVEDPTADHAVHLAAVSGTVARPRLTEPDPGPVTQAQVQGAWLIVHAGRGISTTR